MDITQLFILAVIGILAGFIGGSMGIGGGIIIIPALMIFLGFTQKEAQGTSLAVLTMPVAFVAAMNYYKGGYVNMKFAAIMIVTFVIGSYFGSKFSLVIPASTLKKGSAILLLVIGVKMLLGK